MLDLSRDQANVNATNFPDTRVLKYLNIVKNNFWSYIVTAISEKYNWDIFTVDDIIPNKSEYLIPEVTSDIAWAKKINSILINYDWETYDDWTIKYIKATETDPSILQKDWNYYVNNQDVSKPLYYIADNSYFIAPSVNDLSGSIQVKWIKKIPDYETTTLEIDTIIPIDQHDILIQWVLPYILKAQNKSEESINEKQEYIRQRKEATTELSDRNLSPIYMEYPIDREIPSEILSVN